MLGQLDRFLRLPGLDLTLYRGDLDNLFDMDPIVEQISSAADDPDPEAAEVIALAALYMLGQKVVQAAVLDLTEEQHRHLRPVEDD
jgi:hypothetical protein